MESRSHITTHSEGHTNDIKEKALTLFEKPAEIIIVITYCSQIYGKCQFPVTWKSRKREGDFEYLVDISVRRNEKSYLEFAF